MLWGKKSSWYFGRKISVRARQRQRRHTTLVMVAVILFTIVLIVIFILRQTIYHRSHTIRLVRFDDTSIMQYDDPLLYGAIREQIVDRNYYALSLFGKKSLTQSLQSQFPFVGSISLQHDLPQNAFVSVNFLEPDYRISSHQKQRWILDQHSFEIYSWNTLGQWKDILYLPQYLSWISSISWFFFHIDQSTLYSQFQSLQEYFPLAEQFVYFPGGEKTVVLTHDGKKIYFDNEKSVDEQYEKYELVRSVYEWYERVRELDLSSLDNIVARDR